MKLEKETILGAIIIELTENTGIQMSRFLLRYEEVFKRYVDMAPLRKLLEEKLPEENWEMIQKAKRLALGGKEIEKNEQRYPLCSVFSHLSLDGTYPAKKRYYRPAILDMKNIMLYVQSEKRDYSELVEGFCSELESCKESVSTEFHSFLIFLDTLMKKYFWSIPVGGQQDEDIALYDYMRSLTAIIAVLMQEGNESIPYVLAAGHFSRIQNYIFSVAKVGEGGVTKRLRARSFYVNALVSTLAHRIIHEFDLPMANILMLTGGKFYVLLPNTEDVEERLSQIEKQAAMFLYEKFKGNLSLELVWHEVTNEGLCHYSDTVTVLVKKLEEKKKRLLESVLMDSEGWKTEHFIVYQNLANKSMCASCKSALVDEGEEMCLNCTRDTEIGEKLPKIKRFSFSREKGQYQLLDNYYLNLDVSDEKQETYLIMQLNDSHLEGVYDKPIAIQYMVNDVPVHKTGEVRTFGEIAELADGSKKLGVLKADVDTLGFLFAEGLRSEENDVVSISRINTLSRMLDHFFGGYIHYIIKNGFPNVYCVFSGGDDLLLIGPWSDMPDLAIKIEQKFHEYTGYNPCITLSAAICMANPKEHISVLAERCETKLKQVKQQSDQIISSERRGRNGIYFLEKVMTWEDFAKQIEKGKEIMKLITIIGVGFFRRLATYSGMYQDYLQYKDTRKLIFLPWFSNLMMRNARTLGKVKEFQTYCLELYKKASDYRKVEKDFYYMEFSIRYALLRTKEERKNGGFLGKISK